MCRVGPQATGGEAALRRPSRLVAASRLHQLFLPIGRDPPGWSRHGLVQGVMLRRCEPGPFGVVVGPVVPEPLFPGLEATNNGVTRGMGVRGRMFPERVVTTADVPTFGTPSQVQPPPFSREALDAPGPAWWYLRIDGVRHAQTSHCVCVAWYGRKFERARANDGHAAGPDRRSGDSLRLQTELRVQLGAWKNRDERLGPVSADYLNDQGQHRRFRVRQD